MSQGKDPLAQIMPSPEAPILLGAFFRHEEPRGQVPWPKSQPCLIEFFFRSKTKPFPGPIKPLITQPTKATLLIIQ
jgi:hypothetical protein